MLPTKFQKILSATLICTALVLIGTVFGVPQIPEVQAGMTFMPEHYLGYWLTPKTVPPFESVPIGLVDQFEKDIYEVVKPLMMFNPAQKNKEIVYDDVTHLKKYKLVGPHTSVKDIVLINQFEQLTVDTRRVVSMLVPTAKSHTGPTDPLKDEPVDHFKCYKIRASEKFPGPVPKNNIQIIDTNFKEQRQMKVAGTPLLCNPVQKLDPATGDPLSMIKNPETHLTCYKVKPKVSDTGHDRIRFDTNNQFGPEDLKTRPHDMVLANGKILRNEFCVPTIKILGGPE